MTIEWRKRHLSVLLAISVFFAPGPGGAWTSVLLSGTLLAESDWEAFVSKCGWMVPIRQSGGFLIDPVGFGR